MKDDEEQITFCAGITLVRLQAKGDGTKFIHHYGYKEKTNLFTPCMTTDLSNFEKQ